MWHKKTSIIEEIDISGAFRILYKGGKTIVEKFQGGAKLRTLVYATCISRGRRKLGKGGRMPPLPPPSNAPWT